MRPESTVTRLRRLFVVAAIVAFGIAIIVGSGGGVIGIPDVYPTFPAPVPPTPRAWITPSEPTVQAGTIVRFDANVYAVDAPISYQWRRDGVDIAGATAASYQLGGAQISDDGVLYQVVVTGANTVVSALARLHVSPSPPVMFKDTEFPVTSWSMTATASANGPTASASQPTSGGDPDAYRLLVHQLPAGVSSLEARHANVTASYAPAELGAIYTIDASSDCKVISRSAGVAPMDPRFAVSFEQAGRLYQLGQSAVYCPNAWSGVSRASLREDSIRQIAGPACAANERCPDFSSAGAPMRFGFVTWVQTASSSAAGTLDLGIDNWKVTVWRR